MAYIMYDVQAVKSLPSGVSREETRAWTEKEKANRNANPENSYDFTRTHLNFEVVDGKIRKVSQKSLDQRYRENLARRGIPHPDEAVSHVRKGEEPKKKERIIAASIIIGGTSDFMNRLAFGEQIVDLRKGADNSHLRRLKSIEDFYIDVYNQVGREYGKDNIVSFIVHCDETGVHAHCTVVPTGIVKKRERVSWKSVFGRTKTESSKKFTEIHDRFYNEVGKKYGLERGLPISKTGARHKSKAEYQKELSDGLAKMEKAVKGLTSMVENACGRLGIAVEKGDVGDIAHQLEFVLRKFELLGEKVEEIELFGKKEKNVIARWRDSRTLKESLSKLNHAARQCGILKGNDLDIKGLAEAFQKFHEITTTAIEEAHKDGIAEGETNAMAAIMKSTGLKWEKTPTPQAFGIEFKKNYGEARRVREFENAYGKLSSVAEKMKTQKEDIATAQERSERAWRYLFRIWPTAENAIMAIVSRTNAFQRMFTGEQGRAVWNALRNAEGEQERQAYAEDLMNFAREYMSDKRLPEAWINETAQEVMTIATTAWIALSEMFTTATTQSVRGGGGGGNNDLPKKKKDDDERYACIIGRYGRTVQRKR